MSDLNIFYGEMFNFVSFPLHGFTLVKKLRNFDFKIQSLKYFNKFRSKKVISDVMSNKV